ncbi:hypothetical protein [Consotaella aegiceratis]|uniref:hypothetical protein n=1 Tax=Consotaella aegiceratis TaxID=3097961 RepID=UPI002F4188B2
MAFMIVRPETAFALDPSDKSQRRIRDEQHLAFIRSLPSIISGLYGCEAAHVRYGDPRYRKKRTGRGQKPDDCWCVPLTPEEHRDQHAENEALWWVKQGIDPLAIAQRLYAVSGDEESSTTIILEARKR